MRTLLISERRAAVNVNFAVTKLLALAPHGADKLRLEGDTDLYLIRNKLSCLNIFALTWKTNISTYFNILLFQMISDSSQSKPKAG